MSPFVSLFQSLFDETSAARADFVSIPLIGRAVSGDAPKDLYLAFLQEAYHHVRHTCPLLCLAAAKTRDPVYRDALMRYVEEERGHDEWILADIAALGGDAEAARRSQPGRACRLMVAYAYYAIEWISPYAMLGMVHVLEGMSAQFAGQAATTLAQKFGDAGSGQGFLYLSSHGSLDQEHTAFFQQLVDNLDRTAAPPIIDTAIMMYGLYGDIFRELERRGEAMRHAA